jgi:hypothetical protein
MRNEVLFAANRTRLTEQNGVGDKITSIFAATNFVGNEHNPVGEERVSFSTNEIVLLNNESSFR